MIIFDDYVSSFLCDVSSSLGIFKRLHTNVSIEIIVFYKELVHNNYLSSVY